MSDELKLLIEWSSPWQEFFSAIRPAFQRTEGRLAGEVASGLLPLRGLAGAWLGELLLLLLAIYLPQRLAMLRPFTPPAIPKYDIIYYSGEELPQTEDVGGAKRGRAGKSGGSEAFHRTQVIKVARGESLTPKVLDAPKLDLPKSSAPVANLLAIPKIQGPPPAEGLKSSLPAAKLPASLPVPPPPELERAHERTAPTLTASVVPPVPNAPARDLPAARFPEMRTEVVPPPVSAPAQDTSTKARLHMPAPSVVAPPPAISPNMARVAGTAMGNPQDTVVPPPPPTNTGNVTGRNVASLQTAVVPPPPSLSGGLSAGGKGTGRSGAGAGTLGDLGSLAAPPAAAAGNSTNSAVIVSSQPGSQVGAPSSGVSGSLAMSPAGGAKPGIGGSGTGTGNTAGAGPGSAPAGDGPGSGASGTGPGSSANAKTGISPVPGPGGAGTGSRNGVPTTPGISVQGGSIVTLPSFGGTANAPSAADRSSVNAGQHGPGITVVATSRSGGAFNYYGVLKGDRVYTIYLTTTMGTVVLQFADPTSEKQAYGTELTAPEALRKDLPESTAKDRVVLSGVIDKTGNLKALQILEGKGTALATKLMATLPKWRFQPVMRGDEPVEVTAILGFNIDTR